MLWFFNKEKQNYFPDYCKCDIEFVSFSQAKQLLDSHRHYCCKTVPGTNQASTDPADLGFILAKLCPSPQPPRWFPFLPDLATKLEILLPSWDSSWNLKDILLMLSSKGKPKVKVLKVMCFSNLMSWGNHQKLEFLFLNVDHGKPNSSFLNPWKINKKHSPSLSTSV